MAVVGEAFVKISPQTAGFAQKTESETTGALRGIALKGAAILGGIFAVREGARFVGELVKDGEALTKQQNLVNTAIKQTGNSAHVSSEGLQKYAESQGAVTGQSASAVTKLQQVLLRFTGIRNEVGKGNDIFNQAEGAIQNVSAALGKGLQPVAIAVGKALQDPTHGLTGLQRVGIQFNQQQKDQIKTLVESGNALGAQRFILDTLTQRYGGAAAAAATFTEKLHAEVANVKETLGQSLEPAVGALVNGLTPVIPEIGKVLSGAISAIIPAIVPALQAVGPILLSLVQGLAPILGGIGKVLAQTLAGLSPALIEVGKAVAGLAPLFQPIATVVGIIAKAFSAIAVPAIQAFTSILGTVVNAVLPPLQSALQSIAPVIEQVARILGDSLGAALDTLAPVLGQIASLFATTFATALQTIAPLLPPLATAFGGLLQTFATAFGQVEPIIQAINALFFQLAAQVIGALLPAFTKILTALEPVIPILGQAAATLAGAFLTALTAIAPQLPQLATAFGQLAVAAAKLIVAIVPVVVPLAQLGATLITKIGPPVLIAAATALTALANALTPLISNTKVMVPLLITMGTGFAVFKTVSFATGTLDAITKSLAGLSKVLTNTKDVEALGGSFGKLGSSFEKVKGALKDVVSAFVNLPSNTVNTFVKSLSGAGPAAEKAAAQSLAIGNNAADVIAALGAEGAAAVGASGGMDTLAASEVAVDAAGAPIAAVVAAIAVAVAIVGIAFFEAYKHIGPFRDAVDALGRLLLGVGKAIVSAVEPAVNWIKDNLPLVGEIILAAFLPVVGIPLLIATHLSQIVGFFEALPGHIVSALSSFGSVIGNLLVSAVKSAVDFLVNDLPGMFLQFELFMNVKLPLLAIKGLAFLAGLLIGTMARGAVTLAQALPGMFVAVFNFFNSLPGRIAGAVVDLATTLLPLGVSLVEGFVNGMVAESVAVFNFFLNLPGQIVSAASSLGGTVHGALDTAGNAAIGGLVDGAQAAFGAVVSFFAGLPGKITSAIPAAGSWLAGLGPDIINGLITGITTAVSAIGNFFVTVVTAFVDGFKAGFGISSPAATMIPIGINIIEGIISGALGAVGSLLSFVASLPGRVLGAIGNFLGRFIPLGVQIIEGLVQGAANTVGSLLSFIGGLGVRLVTTLVGLQLRFLSKGAEIILGLLQGATGALGSLLGFLGGLPGRFVAALGNLASRFLAVGKTIIDDIKNGLQAEVSILFSFFSGLPGKIIGAIGDVGSKMVTIGKQLIEGIKRGIEDGMGSLGGFIKDTAGKIIDFFKNPLSIFSPSRKTQEMGQQLMAGLQVGIGDGAGAAAAAAGQSASKIVDAISGGLKSQGVHVSDDLKSALTDAVNHATKDSHGGLVDTSSNFASDFSNVLNNALANGLTVQQGLATFAATGIHPQGALAADDYNTAFKAAVEAGLGQGLTVPQAVTEFSKTGLKAAFDPGTFIDFNSAAFQTKQGLLDLAGTFQQNAGAVDPLTHSLDLNKSAGLAVVTNMQGLASGLIDLSTKQFAATHDVQGSTNALVGNAQAMVNVATQAGIGATQAHQLVAVLLGIPPESAANITTDAALKQAVIGNFQAKILGVQNGSPYNANVNAIVSGDPAVQTLYDHLRNLKNGGPYDFPVGVQFNGISFDSIKQHVLDRIRAVAAQGGPVSIPVTVHPQARNSPLRSFETWDEAVKFIHQSLRKAIASEDTPQIPLVMSTADIKGGSLHPLPDAGKVVTTIIQNGLHPIDLAISVTPPSTAALQKTAFQLAGTLDGLVSSATGKLPSVDSAIQDFTNKFFDALKKATDAGNAFRAANVKLFVDVAHGADLATQLLDSAAINKAGAAGVKAMVDLARASNPQIFIDELKARNDSVTNLQNDLQRLLALGDTALAAEIAKEGPSANRLATFLANNTKAAKQAEDLLRKGQSLQTTFEGFLNTSFGPDFASQAGAAGANAGQSLAEQMANGLLGVLPAARAIVGQLKDVLGPDIATPLANAVNAATTTAAATVQNLPTTTRAIAVTPVPTPTSSAASSTATTSIVVDLTVELPEGGTAKATIPITVPTNPTSLTQRVQATARAQ